MDARNNKSNREQQSMFCKALLPIPLTALVLALAACGSDGNNNNSSSQSTPQSVQDAAVTATPIKHLVVIFGENVSFDHYFGTYPQAANPAGEPMFNAVANTPAVNGLTPALLNNNPNLTNAANKPTQPTRITAIPPSNMLTTAASQTNSRRSPAAARRAARASSARPARSWAFSTATP
jgi:phospholipase C